MYHDRRSRLHLTVSVERPEPQAELCLIWTVFNRGSRPIHVGLPGLLLRDGRRLPAQNDWSPPQVGLQLGVNYSYVRSGEFDLPAGQPDRVCRFVRNIVEHLRSEGFEKGAVDVRPFIRYGEDRVRHADDWWQVDLKAANARPLKRSRPRRVAAKARRVFR